MPGTIVEQPVIWISSFLRQCIAMVGSIVQTTTSAQWAVVIITVSYLVGVSSAFASEADHVEAVEGALEAAMLNAMGVDEDERDETTGVSVLELGEHTAYGDLWVAHGSHDYEATIAVFARSSNGDWGEPLARSSGYYSSSWVGVTTINVGQVENIYFLITVPAGVRYCDTQVYGFDGEEIFEVLSHYSHCSNSEIVQDLDGDSVDEMLLVNSIPVFHQLDGVFRHSAELAYWNGSNFVIVHPSPDDELVEQNIDAALVRRMVEADLWVDASLLSAELSAQVPDDVSLRWSSVLIKRIASLNTDNVSWSQMPFLSTVFAGDYALAFEMMRANFPEMAFSPEGPLTVGSTPDGKRDYVRDDVAEHLLDHTGRALTVRPDDPDIHAVRALALSVVSPDDGTATLAALDRAAALAPGIEWLRSAQSFLRER